MSDDDRTLERERWRRVREICAGALERQGEARKAWLHAACAADEALQGEVESLLEYEREAVRFIETPAAPMAAALLEHDEARTMAQRQIGPYTIRSWLDAGGMGDVYRAWDSKLGRDVAIKVLPPELAADPQRIARFEREAQFLGALNHPNIATIHGFERLDDVAAIVLEFVEGPTLAELIHARRSGPAARGLRTEEALGLALQIAEALEAAHAKGIVHRDLKPANIKVRSDGIVKVLDFGLAKMLEPPPGERRSHPPTDSPTITRAHDIMGTAPYMSPEQARGEPVDTRTDIWAFGCVLYEMLTGHRVFDGATRSDVLARVLEREPDFDALPVDTPPAVARVLRRALAKDVRDRLRDMGDARLELVEALAKPEQSRIGTAKAPGRPWQLPAFAAGVLVGVAVLAVWTAVRTAPSPPRPVSRFQLTLPESAPLRLGGEGTRLFNISPDGAKLAYFTGAGLAVRSRDSGAVEVFDVIAGSAYPFFSPDGAWIGTTGRDVNKVPVSGGPMVRLADAGAGAIGSWGERGIMVADVRGLFRVPADGDTPERIPVATLGPGEQITFPEPLPGGRAVLYTVVPTRTNTVGESSTGPGSRIEALDLRTGRSHVVLRGGGRPRYVPTGHLVYGVGDTLHAVGFDAKRLLTSGNPVQMSSEIGSSEFALSNEGTLVYASGLGGNQRTLVWVDRAGREEIIPAQPRPYVYPRLSPDETRIALDVNGPNRDIWIWYFGRQTLERFTTDPTENVMPVWTPDSTQLYFTSSRSGVPNIWRQPADGSREPERLIMSDRLQQPLSVAPDDRLIFSDAVPGHARDTMALALDGSGRVEPLLATAAYESGGEVSPDGRWIAFTSDESGQFEVYVRPYPRTDSGRRKVSTEGGRQPLWSRDGRELFFRDFGGAVMAVPVAPGPRFAPGPAITLVPPGRSYTGGGAVQSARTYDVSLDSTRFLMIKESAANLRPSLVVVENWFEELKRLVH